MEAAEDLGGGVRDPGPGRVWLGRDEAVERLEDKSEGGGEEARNDVVFLVRVGGDDAVDR